MVFVSVVIWGGIAILGFASAETDSTAGSHVVATVNGYTVAQSEVEREIVWRNSRAQVKVNIENLSSDELRDVILDIALTKELLREAQGNPLLLKRVERGDLRSMIEGYRNNLIVQVHLETIASRQIDDVAIEKRYKSLKKDPKGKEEWRIRHILVAEKKGIKKVKKRLAKRPFEELAKEVSVDRPSAEKGGDLGFLMKEQMVEPFAKAVAGLAVGATSKPFKTKLG